MANETVRDDKVDVLGVMVQITCPVCGGKKTSSKLVLMPGQTPACEGCGGEGFVTARAGLDAFVGVLLPILSRMAQRPPTEPVMVVPNGDTEPAPDSKPVDAGPTPVYRGPFPEEA